MGPGDAALRIVLRSDELTLELHPRFTTVAAITIGCQLQSWQPRISTAHTETAATSSQLRLVAAAAVAAAAVAAAAVAAAAVAAAAVAIVTTVLTAVATAGT